MSFWANVLLGKRPSGQMSSGQIPFMGKCLIATPAKKNKHYFYSDVVKKLMS
jgi:hypothetical protein